MFTGKSSSDTMLRDGFNFHNFVNMALQENFIQIGNPNLLKREV
jgi:hypothetical protein